MITNHSNPAPESPDGCRLTPEMVSDTIELVNADGTLRVFSPATTDPTSLSLRAQYLAHRLDLVKSAGWLPDAEHDVIPYDTNLKTRYIIRSVPNRPDTLCSGLMLTSVPSIEGSYTWHMMNGNTMQDAIRGSEAFAVLTDSAAAGQLWDLTRLLRAGGGRTPPDNAENSVVDLFGGGLRATEDADVLLLRWFFLAHGPMKRFLDRLGIQSTVVVAERMSERDKGSSYFCIIDPTAAMQSLHSSQIGSKPYMTYQRISQAADSLMARRA